MIPSNFIATTDNPVDPDQFNTYIQNVDSVDDLRNFIGAPVMVIFLQGTTAPNDGGQGNFYWNAAGTAPDDNGVTTVTPNGSNPGQWTRINSVLSGEIDLNNAINFADAGTIASAATTSIGPISGNYATISGNATITSFGTGIDGSWRRLRFTGTPTLTYNATSLIVPTAANIVVQAGDTADLVSLGGTNWVMTGFQRASGQALVTIPGSTGITSVNTQTFTGSGTYTPTTGMSYAIVEMIAGGGGGGSIAAATTAGAGGGGSGGYLRARLTAAQIGVSQVVTISGGGTGGASGGSNNGSAGGNVSLGSLLACTGGSGGTAAGVQVSGGTGGTGTVTTGTSMVAMTGGTGGVGGFNTVAFGGNGADSCLGQGGGFALATIGSSIAGLPGNGYGAGGAGSCSNGSSTTQAGGNGSPGIIIITEYISA